MIGLGIGIVADGFAVAIAIAIAVGGRGGGGGGERAQQAHQAGGERGCPSLGQCQPRGLPQRVRIRRGRGCHAATAIQE